VLDEIILEDTTLRDGEQAPGIAFDRPTKLALLDALIDAGVRWVEVGIPAMGGDELAFLEEATSRADRATLVAWNRGVAADVEQSLDLGYRAVHIGLPASDVHLRNSVRRDRSWLFRTAEELVGLAKGRGAFVSISAEDVGRTDPAFLVEYARVVAAAGADRLRLSDTIGILGPEGYAERVRAVVGEVDVDVQCHTHNDFGLALANTLAGLQAGARYFHVTINGVAERAGMPDLAAAVVVLERIYGRSVGVRLEALTALSRLVEAATRHPVLPWHPVVGGNVFAHESGIHTNGMLRDTSTFEPYAPDDVGGERRYVVGKHSGTAVVEWVLRGQGLEPDDDELRACLALAREAALDHPGGVPPEALVELYQQVSGGRP
jgi:homocitrate synthase NifV